MPTRPASDLTLAPWWGEFLAVKDRLSWSALAARFAVSSNQLNLALASAGLTKQALPPGRKPRSPVAEAPIAAPAAPGPADALRRLAGTQPDGEVALAAGVTVDEVKSFRRTHNIPGYLRAPPGVSAPAPTPAPAAPAPAPSAGVVVRRTTAPGKGVQEVRRPIPAPTPTLVTASQDPTPAKAAPRPAKAAPRPAKAAPLPAKVDPLERFRKELGTVGDHVIAARAGVTRERVGAFRREQGIPAYAAFRSGPRRKLKPAGVEAPTGVQAPVVAAPMVEAPAVVQAPAAGAASKAPAAIPRPAGRAPSVVAPYADLLGTIPDGAVGAMAGVSRDAVKEYRKRLGIAPFRLRPVAEPAPGATVGASAPAQAASLESGRSEGREAKAQGRPRASKIDAFAHLVGVESDREVAQRAGVTVGNVQAWRTRRGIAASQSVARAARQAAPQVVEAAPTPTGAAAPAIAAQAPAQEPTAPPAVAPAPEAPPPAAVQRTELADDGGAVLDLLAYRLRATHGGETHELYVVAAGIADAAARAGDALARRGDGWRVVAIEELGRAVG